MGFQCCYHIKTFFNLQREWIAFDSSLLAQFSSHLLDDFLEETSHHNHTCTKWKIWYRKILSDQEHITWTWLLDLILTWTPTELLSCQLYQNSLFCVFLLKRHKTMNFDTDWKKSLTKINSPFIISSLLSSRVKGTPSVSHFSRSNEKKLVPWWNKQRRFPFSNCRKQLCFVTKQNEAIARAVSSQSDSSLQRRAQKREHKYRKKTFPTNEKERDDHRDESCLWHG